MGYWMLLGWLVTCIVLLSLWFLGCCQVLAVAEQGRILSFSVHRRRAGSCWQCVLSGSKVSRFPGGPWRLVLLLYFARAYAQLLSVGLVVCV